MIKLRNIKFNFFIKSLRNFTKMENSNSICQECKGKMDAEGKPIYEQVMI